MCAVLAGCGQDQVAIRPSGILARRLNQAPLPLGRRPPWAPRGTVLVTGVSNGDYGTVAYSPGGTPSKQWHTWLAGLPSPTTSAST